VDCGWIWLAKKDPADIKSCPHCSKYFEGHTDNKQAKPIIVLPQEEIAGLGRRG